MTLTADDIQKYATPEELAELDALLTFEERTLVTLADLHVQDKQTKAIVPLLSVLNKPQRDVLTELEIDPYQPIPDLSQTLLRLRILKARREGISTIIAAIYFCDTYNHRERNTVVMAHLDDSAGEIFELYRRFYTHLPAHKKRKAQKSGGGELYWADTNSSISVATAGSINVKSGATIHNLHKSEYAKWRGDVAAIDASVNIATQYGNIIEETTADGMNHFYEKWEESERRQNRYRPYFLPWFADPVNASPVPEGFRRTEEEEERAETYGLSDNQLQWYREMKTEYKGLTPQEFPHTPREAFVSSGNKVFDTNALEAQEARVQGVQAIPAPSLWYKNSRGDKVYLHRLRSVHASGELKIFEEAQEKTFYLVSADPASGANKKGDLDYCSASVWAFHQFRPLEQVAHLYGQWEPNQFAHLIAELGYYYYNAMVVVLSMNHGTAVNTTLENEIAYPQNRGNGWGGLYYHDPTDLNQKMQQVEGKSRQAGWPETPGMSGGKAFAVGQAQQYITEEEVIFNSPITVTQCFQYVHLPGGNMGSEAGHDDAVSDFYCAAAVYRLRGHKARETQLRASRGRQEYEDDPDTGYQGWGNGRRRDIE
jgi:hypothetical protein